VTYTIARRCYEMGTVATGEDVMSPKPIATEGHNNDGRFSDMTKDAL
jgi:hypothetical protein